jgi:hypothetical protein
MINDESIPFVLSSRGLDPSAGPALTSSLLATVPLVHTIRTPYPRPEASPRRHTSMLWTISRPKPKQASDRAVMHYALVPLAPNLCPRSPPLQASLQAAQPSEPGSKLLSRRPDGPEDRQVVIFQILFYFHSTRSCHPRPSSQPRSCSPLHPYSCHVRDNAHSAHALARGKSEPSLRLESSPLLPVRLHSLQDGV